MDNSIWTSPFSSKASQVSDNLIKIYGLVDDGSILHIGKVGKLTPEIMNYYTRLAVERRNIQKIVAVGPDSEFPRDMNFMYDAIQKKWLGTGGTSTTTMVSGNSIFSFQENLSMGTSPMNRRGLDIQQGIPLSKKP